MRKNKKFSKNIFIIMNNEMENNIQKKDNSQYFSDCTYYALPPYNRGSKIWILIAFNKSLFKTLLCCISIIKNENKETILTILDYLSLKYNFNPNIITLDFGRGPYVAFKTKFPNCRIFPCFFHFIQRILLHLKEINSTNKTLKKKAKDLLANIKLLCFINNNEIDSFYDKIYRKYNKTFPKFFKYFNNTYLDKGLFSDRNWNYYNISSLFNNNDLYFFTNNICESNNRTLNLKYIGVCKSYYGFRNAILELINIFKEKKPYEEKYCSITHALDYYGKN